MDEDSFWKIVQTVNDSSGGDMDQKCDELRQQISALPRDAALDFARLFDAKMDEAYCWPLWGDAYIIQGGAATILFPIFVRR